MDNFCYKKKKNVVNNNEIGGVVVTKNHACSLELICNLSTLLLMFSVITSYTWHLW